MDISTETSRRKRTLDQEYQRYSIYFPTDLMHSLRTAARDGRVSYSELVEDAVRRYLGAGIHILYLQGTKNGRDDGR